MTRFFDIIFSALGLIILSPLLLVIWLLIVTESRGGGFYTQERIGKDGVPFRLYKFRSMRPDSDKGSLITIGGHDSRITRSGYFIRKYKLDELPQRYVDLYTPEQRVVLRVRPGITDYASIEYADENEILGKADDPERTYIEQIMPEKIRYNLKYINHPTVGEYFKIIFLTFKKIIS